LEKLREESPIAGLILDYRELAKLLGTYIDTIPTQVDEHSRLHADFLQAGTTTDAWLLPIQTYKTFRTKRTSVAKFANRLLPRKGSNWCRLTIRRLKFALRRFFLATKTY